jgi:citrate synthase
VKLLEQKLEAQFATQRAEIARLKREYGKHVISEITVAQVYGGARGVTSIVCDTSEVDPIKGLIIRGWPVKELAHRDAEDCFWLLLTGELPTRHEQDWLTAELHTRRNSKEHLAGFAAQDDPANHPVSRMCMAMQWMQQWSSFKRNDTGPKSELWRWALDDALDIIAVMPDCVALLTGVDLHFDELVSIMTSGSWSAAIGWAVVGKKFGEPEDGYGLPTELMHLMRLYVLVHSDHEGSNACALACRTAASTLADPYLALTAGWRALAGPIHGLASQVCIEFSDELRRKLGDSPTDDGIAAEVQARIDSGKVIPGFGHAVLRAMDPRYALLYDFAMQHFPDDPAMRIAAGLRRVVPPLLTATGKVANPWPNVDGITGAVMQHYGLTDYRWLTVLFAACMSLGLLAQMVVSRGLGEPILHPKAITPEMLKAKF